MAAAICLKTVSYTSVADCRFRYPDIMSRIPYKREVYALCTNRFLF